MSKSTLPRSEIASYAWDRLEEIMGPVPAQDFEEVLFYRKNLTRAVVKELSDGQCVVFRAHTPDDLGRPRWLTWAQGNKVTSNE